MRTFIRSLLGAALSLAIACTAHAALLGDYAPATNICGKFPTFRPSTGATFTLAGTPALSVYKDSSTTQSTTGVTLTADFDSVTGLNHFCIDTSADGTFYSAGSNFDIVITTGTVDSVSVTGAVVANFTLSKTAALRPATAGRQVVVDAAGLADANAVKVGPTGSGTAQTARDLGASVLLSSGTGTGQISLSSGAVLLQATQTGVTIPTVTTVTTATNLTNAPTAGDFTATMKTSIGTAVAASAVASVTGAVGSVTGAVGSVTGNVGGNVTGSVGSIATGGISEASYATTAGSFKPLGIARQGTAQSATGTTLVLDSSASFADDTAIGMTVVACGSTQGYCQARAVTDYVGSTDTATVDTWTVTPSGTITFYLFNTAPFSGGGGSGLDAAGVRAAIGLASANLDTQLGAIDDFIDTEVGAIKTKTDFLPSATAGAAGGLFIAGTNAATTITTALTTTFTGNLTGSAGSVTGAVGSVTGAVGSVTGSVGSVTGAVGSVTGAVGSIATGGITNASFAADAISASKINADVTTEIWSLSCTEPAAKPSWGSTNLQGWICWIGAWSRNEINQTATSKALRNDADNANLVTCAVSDDGTTFSVQECSP